MSVALPDYDYCQLFSFSVCALIEDTSGIKVPDEKLILESRCDEFRSAFWIRVIENMQSDPTGIHFHVDTCREESFDDDEIPEETAPLSDIRAKLGEFLGKEFGGFLVASFEVPVEIISTKSVVAVLAGVSMGREDSGVRLTGAELSIDDGPVRLIRWSLKDNRTVIRVTVRGEISGTINENYLRDGLDVLRTAFQSLVFRCEEGDSNANA